MMIEPTPSVRRAEASASANSGTAVASEIDVSRRPPRLRGFDYVGVYRHSLTASTHQHQRAFTDATFAAAAREQLLRSSSDAGFAVTAFCFMPDHVHALLTGLHANSAFLPLVNRWRQSTGVLWRRNHTNRLWQEGYWDRTLREDDDTLAFAAYIVNNPIRAGLADSLFDYPWLGSSDYTLEQLAEAIQMRPDRRDRSRFGQG
jgi:putative transposase